MSEKEQEEKKQMFSAPEETVTITPTMIDDSEDTTEIKRDLSSIIPKSNNTATENSVELISKEAELKGDGAISLGTINIEGEITMNPNAKLPEQIDLEERKKQAQKNKGIFKKEKKKKQNKAAQKFQNKMALLSLLVIVGLGGFWYWLKNHPTEKDFKPLPVTIELGNPLPIRGSEYVKPGVGKKVDELKYAIDLKEVKVEEVGDYPFTVTYQGITKQGTVSVVDTTPPDLKVREVVIKEGDRYNASQFVEGCKDYSGCNYSFQNPDKEGNYTEQGNYVVFVTATDAFNNTTIKKASLIIESIGKTRKYTREWVYDFKAGYKKIEVYELTFLEYDTYSALLRGRYTVKLEFQDENKFKAAVKTYSSESGVTIDEAKLTITTVSSVSSIGSNYTHLDDIEAYLKKEDFYG